MRFFTVYALMTSLILGFVNCGRSGFVFTKFDSTSSSSITTGDGGGAAETTEPTSAAEKASVESGLRLLSSDQVLRSFERLTGVAAINADVQREYTLQTSSLADSPLMSAISGPLFMSSTALASQFCNQAITREIAMPSDSRRLFVGVNFTAAPAQLNGTVFESFVRNLSQKYWGRDLSTEELGILKEGRTEFESGISGSATATAQTRNMALYFCSAMLSSLDSLTM